MTALRKLKAKVRIAAERVSERLANRLGFDLVRRGYYSVVPALEKLDDEVFERRSALNGIHFDTREQLRFATSDLARYFDELADGRAAPWTPDAISYGAVDGEVLYGMIRHLRPQRVIELGSGFSTHVLRAAARANRDEGDASELVTYDPFPRVDPDTEAGFRVEQLRAQDVPLEAFAELESGDVLFVDTTHTVTVDSDVNRIVLDVLPSLADGVVVHFHDILLPGEYYRAWFAAGAIWGEQYLLQAFLSMNPHFEVLWGSAGVRHDHLEELSALVPSLGDHRPSALWIRKLETSGAPGR